MQGYACTYPKLYVWMDTGTIVRNDCSKGATCDFAETKKAQPTSIRCVGGGEALSSSLDSIDHALSY